MSSTWLPVISSLGAAVVGGIVAPQLLQSRERRASRAAVREKIAEVEVLRWEDEPYQEFRKAIAALESAAMIARVPRHPVQEYVRAAEQARHASQVHPGGPDGEPITTLDEEHDELVQGALDRLSRLLWRPWVGRLAVKASRRSQT
jgi:hypothetical protein